MLVRLVIGLVSVVLPLMPGIVLAHSKTDVITLVNGNEITGEIKGLLQGKLSYGTDSMGTVQVEWKDVAAVTSEFQYEVRLVNGNRYYGSLATGNAQGTVKVVTEDGEDVVAVLDIVELREIEQTFADRINIRLGLGYSYAKAADVGSFSFTSKFGYENERGLTDLTGRTDRTHQDGGSVGSNRYSLSRQIWTRREQVIRWFNVSYEDNDELDLDYRFAGGVGLGKAIVDTNRQSLIAFLGIQVASEESVDSEKFNSVEGVLGGTYALWRFDTPEVELTMDGTIYPGITESGRWRGNGNFRLSWELVEDLFWDITAWTTYDNQSQSGSTTDYGVSIGLGWEY